MNAARGVWSIEMSELKKKVFNRRSFLGLCGTGAAGTAYTRFAEAE
jgi:hypothetical protein